MRRPALSRFTSYLLAVLAIAAVTALLHLMRGVLHPPTVVLLYLLAVVLTSAVGGLGPGIAAAFLAFLAFNYFFIEPYFTLGVHHVQDVLALLVFFTVAVFISQLVSRAQSSLAEAQAREREATHLYELSMALAGLRNEEAIARVAAGHIRDTFRDATVEVLVQASGGSVPTTMRAAAGNKPLSDKPDWVFPLNTARGLLGEIRVWHTPRPPMPAEERMLRAFANQTALAVERTALAQTETRAKVLEESDRLKSALLSSVSHELRSPLATIKAAITSLRSGEVAWAADAREELLAAVEEETDHLNRLVGNLLDMSRIEAGALRPQREWNSLAEIVGGTLERLRRASEQHVLEVDVSDDLPLLPIDPVQMSQVFSNLLSNCLKYAPPNTTVRVAAHVQDADTLLVQVSNEGPPVPALDLERIFDKFYRVTAADRVTGTGLGLSICKGIVEAHGGRIWAVNLPNGFAFNFTLPLTWDGERPSSVPLDTETP